MFFYIVFLDLRHSQWELRDCILLAKVVLLIFFQKQSYNILVTPMTKEWEYSCCFRWLGFA